jgi:hypothetical protein
MKIRRLFTTTILLFVLPLTLAFVGMAQTPAGKKTNPNPSLTKKSNTPQAAGSNLPVQGSGTLGRLTKWTGLTTSTSYIADTTIFESKTGMVGIGTDTPTSKLTVQGMIETTLGGYKFPDGTVQTTAAISGLNAVFHNTTLTGNGTQASPLGVAVPLELSGTSSSAISPILKVTNTTDSGTALAAYGGHKTGDNPGGVGVKSFGGDNPNYTAGVGVEANGGKSVSGNGGIGLFAYGGFSESGFGGTGIVAHAGNIFGGIGIPGYAAQFTGGVHISNGNLTVTGTKNFKIDHPLDPENKYLHHAAIESSEVLNIYSGNVTTDENGEAVVSLPEWFEAINQDFRYQLTVVGQFAQAIVASKIKDNRFQIKTNAAQVEVSWQVTGIRSDAAMRKHPFKVEENKLESERGYYLSPEAFGQSEERSITWARHPEIRRQMKQVKPQQ